MIYLYVKQHSITGLKYFGRTESKNPFQYNGSGIYWRRHYNKHGKQYIKTLEIYGFDNQDLCTEFALKFSLENNIVKSSDWANLIIEDGKRVSSNIKTQKEVNQQISKTLKDKYSTGEIYVHTWNKGIPMTVDAKIKASTTWANKKLEENYIPHNKGKAPWNKGKPGLQTPWNKGKPGLQTAWNKGKSIPKVKCPYCDKEGGDNSMMRRWHFDNCRNKSN